MNLQLLNKKMALLVVKLNKRKHADQPVKNHIKICIIHLRENDLTIFH